MAMSVDFATNTVSVAVFSPYALHAPYSERPKRIPTLIQPYTPPETLTKATFSIVQPLIGGSWLSFLDSLSYEAEKLENLEAINAISEHWKQHLFDLSASTDVDALSETIEGVYDAIDRFGPGAVDLASLGSEGINGEHLAAILRATFPFQNRIPGWSCALGEAVKALQRDGVDVDDALAGLL